MPPPTLREIQQAINKLSPADREALARWLHEAGDRIDENRAAEPAAAYRAIPDRQPLTVEEYLNLEAASPTRHEYVGGEIHAMAGASRGHNLLAGNFFGLLFNHIRGGPCKAYIADFKVYLRVDSQDVFYYPDVMVACGTGGRKDQYLDDPRLIVEVLSPSTEDIDRREKALNYCRIPSLQEYVLVAQDRCEVTIRRRNDKWAPEVLLSLEATAELRSLGLALPVGELYRGAL